jgi:hypothetical protein
MNMFLLSRSVDEWVFWLYGSDAMTFRVGALKKVIRSDQCTGWAAIAEAFFSNSILKFGGFECRLRRLQALRLSFCAIANFSRSR